MKLLIYTQVEENYGAHDWSGEGECPQYWKFKGGETFVVRDLTQSQIEKINSEGISDIEELICSDSDYYKEYVINYTICDDDTQETEEWESPVELYWQHDRWNARRVTNNDGQMRLTISQKIETWVPKKAGGVSNYNMVLVER